MYFLHINVTSHCIASNYEYLIIYVILLVGEMGQMITILFAKAVFHNTIFSIGFFKRNEYLRLNIRR